MNPETFTDQRAHGVHRRPSAAAGRSARARKLCWMLALAPVLCASAAFAETPAARPANGKFAGVGMVIHARGGSLVVEELLPNSPAAASALIQKGDRLLAIAEGEEPSQPLAGKTVSEAVGMIRGSAGSTVRVTVASEGADDRDAREVLLTRETLNLESANNSDDNVAPPVAVTPGAATPGLAFERLPGGEADKLSSYRGKIVVLEFWATWGSLCEGAMADLQRTAAQSNALRGKVVFLTISIDRGKAPAAARLQEKGWKETLNGWAAHEALAPWRIHGLPATYVIDAGGQIVAGNPRMTREMLEDLITPLLKN